MKIPLLAETALLTHGLTTISNEELLQQFPGDFDMLVWAEQGEICKGNIEAFLPMRDRAAELKRIDGNVLDEACQKGISGALTASGTMAVAAKVRASEEERNQLMAKVGQLTIENVNGHDKIDINGHEKPAKMVI